MDRILKLIDIAIHTTSKTTVYFQPTTGPTPLDCKYCTWPLSLIKVGLVGEQGSLAGNH